MYLLFAIRLLRASSTIPACLGVPQHSLISTKKKIWRLLIFFVGIQVKVWIYVLFIKVWSINFKRHNQVERCYDDKDSNESVHLDLVISIESFPLFC
jgi:hypothetical protein